MKSRRAHLTVTLLDLAQLAHTQWFFGNVYEGVVKIPERLSAGASSSGDIDELPRTMFGRGSPVRYYVPAVAIGVGGTLGAFITGLGSARGNRWLAIATGCWVSGTAVTAYLVRNVNVKLFFATEPPPPAERDALVRTWYRLNTVRVTAAAGAVLATYRAKRASLKASGI